MNIFKRLSSSTNLSYIIGVSFLVLLLILLALISAHRTQTIKLEALLSQTQESASKMRYFSELVEYSRTRTRLTAQILTTEDIFEQDEINQKLEGFAGKYAAANQKLKEFKLSAEEQEIRNEQNLIISKILPAQRKAVQLAMHGDEEEKEQSRYILYQVVLPDQNRLTELFSQLILIQQQNIDLNANLYKEELSQVNEKESLVSVIVLLLFSIVIIFVIKRVREIQAELIDSHNMLERKIDERTADLKRARDEADRSNKAKSEFLSSMSHELRTPLTAILGYSQLIEMDKDLKERNKSNIKEVTRAGHHLLDLINEVLDLAKIESGTLSLSLEPVYLDDLIKECVTLVTPATKERNISLNVKGNYKQYVVADSIRLKQVMINLLSNATKYNRDNGSITIELSDVDNRRIRIEVEDTGKGIERSDLKHVFQPFNRLNKDQTNIEGTGIGLTITSSLVEMMNGVIGVDSNPGEGSRFWFELERSEVEVPQAQNDTGVHGDVFSAEAVEHGTKTVLYFEDNKVNINLITQLLNAIGNVKLYASLDPVEGLELLDTIRPDLVLLDINMPKLNGYQVLEIIRKKPELADKPVIALTANATKDDIEKGKEKGFNEYITKPLDIRNFMSLIKNYLED